MTEFPELQQYEGQTIEDMKLWFEAMMQRGQPLILHPAIAKDATGKGFEEGVHFIVSRPIPLT